jgi:trans-feruloyl-CoA hydratase/vanillin synthase
MELETLQVIREEGITTVTFDRPHKKNAMNPRMHVEMTHVLDELWFDPGTRILVLTGAGDSFVAGNDLKEYFVDMEARGDPIAEARNHKLATEWRGRTLRLFPKPTIAAINGFCFGGAFSIVESCDLAIAAEEALFGLSEINFMTFPGGTVTKALANILRPRDALYYAMTGRTFDGRKAAEMGFVNYAVPRERLREETMDLARELVKKTPVALELAKEVFKHSLHMDWEAAMSYSMGKTFESRWRQNNAPYKEGMGAFLTKQFRPGLETYQPPEASEQPTPASANSA